MRCRTWLSTMVGKPSGRLRTHAAKHRVYGSLWLCSHPEEAIKCGSGCHGSQGFSTGSASALLVLTLIIASPAGRHRIGCLTVRLLHDNLAEDHGSQPHMEITHVCNLYLAHSRCRAMSCFRLHRQWPLAAEVPTLLDIHHNSKSYTG